jgi:hydroxypyruvate isomerase
MKEARGIFTDIAQTLESRGVTCILTDLNTQDEMGNITLRTLSEQAKIVQAVYERNQDGLVDLVCHSQGCNIATLAFLPKIRKTIFLAPPTDNDISKSIAYFTMNPQTKIDIEGISSIARRDGTCTIVPRAYWDERKQINYQSAYEQFLAQHKVDVVKATLDDVISNENTDTLFRNVPVHEIIANHNFTGDARKQLVQLCEQILID